MSADTQLKTPRLFISYSWSSPEHENWVLELATALRQNGIDVILDKWDLKEGQDAGAFMESMVSDPTVEKVLIISDKVYAEKANSRKGGVGIESQIISPELYSNTKQTKFVAAVRQVDDQGKPYLPIFYVGKIHFDLTSDIAFAENFEKIVRWCFDKPLHVKPEIGSAPIYLDASGPKLPTSTLASRAKTLLQQGSLQSIHAVRDYLNALASGLEQFRIAYSDPEKFPELVLDSIGGFLPYRNEFISVVEAAARYAASNAYVDELRAFFEKIADYASRPENPGMHRKWDWDNFKFIVQELFLYTTSILLEARQFALLNAFLTGGFYVKGDDGARRLYDFRAFRWHLASLEHASSKRGKVSLASNLLNDRSTSSGLHPRSLMQADFLLYLRGCQMVKKLDDGKQWFPDTLLFAHDYDGPFEIFARSQSSSYFRKILPLIGVEAKVELVSLVDGLKTDSYPFLAAWNFHHVPVKELIDLDRIGTIS